jgi:hypothetical protein
VSFYQTTGLWFLLAAAIPVIIHLLNRRRHKTVPWAAMQFLLKATRESRGKKKWRHYLILAARTLALGSLAFAVARPMVGGWLGWGTGRIDTVILLLDRSPSMELVVDGATASKRELALDRVRDAMKALDATKLVMIDSASMQAQEVPSPEGLMELTSTRATDAAASLPLMMQRAAEYLLETQSGKAEIWIASDLQASNWQADDERWSSAVATLQSAAFPPTVRLLSLTQGNGQNVSMQLMGSQRIGKELVLDLQVQRSDDGSTALRVPLSISHMGAVTSETLEVQGQQMRFQKRIVVGDDASQGHGSLSLPADANARDNRVHFRYTAAQPIQSLVVADSSESTKYLTAAAAPQGYANQRAEVIAPRDFGSQLAKLASTAAVLWAANFPTGNESTALQAYLEQGGQVLFFPPKQVSAASFLGVSWAVVDTAPSGKFFLLEDWRHDDGLLRDTIHGQPLLGESLRAIKKQVIEKRDQGLTTLATWDDGSPFLSRLIRQRGTAWFFTSLPDYTWSNLGDAHLLLPAVQRAVLEGAARFDAALLTEVPRAEAWSRGATMPIQVDAQNDPTVDPQYRAGVYQIDDRVIARNVAAAEHDPMILAADDVAKLLGDVSFRRFEENATSTGESEQRELWTWFLCAMLGFLLLEAILCLPKFSASPERSSSPVTH